MSCAIPICSSLPACLNRATASGRSIRELEDYDSIRPNPLPPNAFKEPKEAALAGRKSGSPSHGHPSRCVSCFESSAFLCRESVRYLNWCDAWPERTSVGAIRSDAVRAMPSLSEDPFGRSVRKIRSGDAQRQFNAASRSGRSTMASTSVRTHNVHPARS